ncbi:hypothetical protein [Tolumonas lignilytica]|uniref:hypothetical protein n=1 Tax=Tolumonas lignilytica TaxID=1283284 RepID=UPI0004641188|nr:hypothetical protein [Tolumonas lignilytica]
MSDFNTGHIAGILASETRKIDRAIGGISTSDDYKIGYVIGFAKQQYISLGMDKAMLTAADLSVYNAKHLIEKIALQLDKLGFSGKNYIANVTHIIETAQ